MNDEQSLNDKIKYSLTQAGFSLMQSEILIACFMACVNQSTLSTENHIKEYHE